MSPTPTPLRQPSMVEPSPGPGFVSLDELVSIVLGAPDDWLAWVWVSDGVDEGKQGAGLGKVTLLPAEDLDDRLTRVYGIPDADIALTLRLKKRSGAFGPQCRCVIDHRATQALAALSPRAAVVGAAPVRDERDTARVAQLEAELGDLRARMSAPPVAISAVPSNPLDLAASMFSMMNAQLDKVVERTIASKAPAPATSQGLVFDPATIESHPFVELGRKLSEKETGAFEVAKELAPAALRFVDRLFDSVDKVADVKKAQVAVEGDRVKLEAAKVALQVVEEAPASEATIDTAATVEPEAKAG